MGAALQTRHMLRTAAVCSLLSVAIACDRPSQVPDLAPHRAERVVSAPEPGPNLRPVPFDGVDAPAVEAASPLGPIGGFQHEPPTYDLSVTAPSGSIDAVLGAPEETTEPAPASTDHGGFGRIIVEQSHDRGHTYVAVTAELDSAEGYQRCTKHAVAGCTIRRCAGPDGTKVSAGPIAVTGGAQDFLLTSIDGHYAPKSTNQRVWLPRATMLFAAPGDTAPALSASVRAPSELKSSLPQDATIDRFADFDVQWRGAASDTVVVAIEKILQAKAPTVALTSEFAGSHAGASIPWAALSTMLSGDVQISVHSKSTATVVTGEWTVVFDLLDRGVDLEGRPATVTATLE